jgi:hypothetical protein
VSEVAHIVLLAFRPDAAPDVVEGLLEQIRDYRQIEGVTDVHTSDDVTVGGEPSHYTHGVIIEFTDAAARDRYLPHPSHLAVVARLDPLLEHKLVFDITKPFRSREVI